MTERGSREIEREIDRTRAELDDTLDQMQDKLSPRRWVDDGLEYLRHKGGGDIVRGVARLASEHPFPVALMLGGAAWLYFAIRYPSEGRRLQTERAEAAPAVPAASRTRSATKATGDAPLAVSPDA